MQSRVEGLPASQEVVYLHGSSMVEIETHSHDSGTGHLDRSVPHLDQLSAIAPWEALSAAFKSMPPLRVEKYASSCWIRA